MEAYKTITTLRAVRHFTDQPLAGETLTRILQAGRWTGSAKNVQPWHFVVVRQRETLERLAGCGRYASHVRGAAAAVAIIAELPSALSVHPHTGYFLGIESTVLVEWLNPAKIILWKIFGLANANSSTLIANSSSKSPGKNSESDARKIHFSHRHYHLNPDCSSKPASSHPGCRRHRPGSTGAYRTGRLSLNLGH